MPKLSEAFFAAVRKSLFAGKLTQDQVDGMNAIASAFDRDGDGNPRHLAYILATAKLETDSTMQPLREYGRGKGKPYGKKDATGQAPYGRGLVQLTWDYNYRKADEELGLGGALVKNYDLALDLDLSARIIVRGMIEGWFTTRKLADYPDFKNMRRVVNGLDKADLIATYANSFLVALQLPADAVPAPPVAPTPAVEPSTVGGVLAAIINAILALFSKGTRK